MLDPEQSLTPNPEGPEMADPRSLAVGALDGAEWHARRAGGETGEWLPAIKALVWAAGAVVYALLEVARQIREAGKAGKW